MEPRNCTCWSIWTLKLLGQNQCWVPGADSCRGYWNSTGAHLIPMYGLPYLRFTCHRDCWSLGNKWPVAIICFSGSGDVLPLAPDPPTAPELPWVQHWRQGPNMSWGVNAAWVLAILLVSYIDCWFLPTVEMIPSARLSSTQAYSEEIENNRDW